MSSAEDSRFTSEDPTVPDDRDSDGEDGSVAWWLHTGGPSDPETFTPTGPKRQENSPDPWNLREAREIYKSKEYKASLDLSPRHAREDSKAAYARRAASEERRKRALSGGNSDLSETPPRGFTPSLPTRPNTPESLPDDPPVQPHRLPDDWKSAQSLGSPSVYGHSRADVSHQAALGGNITAEQSLLSRAQEWVCDRAASLLYVSFPA